MSELLHASERQHAAVVFGGTGGIGAKIVERLARNYSVHVAARDVTVFRGSQSSQFFTCDVRNGSDVDALFAQLAERGVEVDLVVNSAGVGGAFDLLAPNSKAWSEMLDTNVTGLANELSSILRLAPSVTTFFQISSVAGRRLSPLPEYLLYSISKMAAEQLLSATRSLPEVVDRELRIISIAPSFVRHSRFAKKFYSDQELPHGRYDDHFAIDPSEVAEVVAALAERPTVWITELTVARGKDRS